jgi:hypothetical protein
MDIKPDHLYIQVTEVYKRYTNPEAISNTFVSMNSAITYCLKADKFMWKFFCLKQPRIGEIYVFVTNAAQLRPSLISYCDSKAAGLLVS